MCWSSGMVSSPTRRVSCPTRWRSLVCKIPISLLGLSETNTISVAERSFSFLDRVQMCVKPMAQPILGHSRQLQDEMRKIERFKDFKEASSVHDNMRALGT